MVGLVDDTCTRAGAAASADAMHPGAGGPLQLVTGRPSSRLIVTAMAIAGVLTTLVSRWLTTAPVTADPGGVAQRRHLTRVGLPVAQFVQELAGVAVVGALFMACLDRYSRAGSGTPAPSSHGSAVGLALVGQCCGLAPVHALRPRRRPRPRITFPSGTVTRFLGTDRVMAGVVTLWVACCSSCSPSAFPVPWAADC